MAAVVSTPGMLHGQLALLPTNVCFASFCFLFDKIIYNFVQSMSLFTISSSRVGCVPTFLYPATHPSTSTFIRRLFFRVCVVVDMFYFPELALQPAPLHLELEFLVADFSPLVAASDGLTQKSCIVRYAKVIEHHQGLYTYIDIIYRLHSISHSASKHTRYMVSEPRVDSRLPLLAVMTHIDTLHTVHACHCSRDVPRSPLFP